VIGYCSRVGVAIDYLQLMNGQSASGRSRCRYAVVSAVVCYFVYNKTLTFVLHVTSQLYSDNYCILRTLACRYSVQYEILGLASKYGLNTVQNSKSMVKDAILWGHVLSMKFIFSLFLFLWRSFLFDSVYSVFACLWARVYA